MQIIVQALTRLFRISSRLTVKTSRNLMTHGTAQCGINALRRFSVSYNELSEADRAVYNEVIQYTTRFAEQYIRHHDENHEYRMQGHSLEEVLQSHATEIFNAAKGALNSRVRSHAYDFAVGKPQRTAIFMREDVLKQFVSAVIEEVCEGIANEGQPRRY
jgi:hypothetical protein